MNKVKDTWLRKMLMQDSYKDMEDEDAKEEIRDRRDYIEKNIMTGDITPYINKLQQDIKTLEFMDGSDEDSARTRETVVGHFDELLDHLWDFVRHDTFYYKRKFFEYAIKFTTYIPSGQIPYANITETDVLNSAFFIHWEDLIKLCIKGDKGKILHYATTLHLNLNYRGYIDEIMGKLYIKYKFFKGIKIWSRRISDIVKQMSRLEIDELGEAEYTDQYEKLIKRKKEYIKNKRAEVIALVKPSVLVKLVVSVTLSKQEYFKLMCGRMHRMPPEKV